MAHMRPSNIGLASGQWSPQRRGQQLGGSTLHIIGVPLLILASIGVGFVMVILKEILIPFVVSIFFVYLIRPMVNILTTPFGRIFPCCAEPAPTHANSSTGRGKYSRLDRSDDAGEEFKEKADQHRPARASSPSLAKSSYPRTVRSAVTRVAGLVTECGGGVSSPRAQVGGGGGGTGLASGRRPGPQGKPSSSYTAHPDAEDTSGRGECGCCCGPLRFTRCPRWFAILVAMAAASALLAGLVIMVADAIQRFQQESLGIFVEEASRLVDKAQRWLAQLGVALEGHAILDAIKQQITVPFLVQTTVSVLVDGVGNAILVLLLVLYLLSEADAHGPGSLRARIDEQIQRYLGIKTLISALQGALAYAIMGPWGLQVRMAHVFGVIHFLLNYIPTAGPIIATLIPLPVIILDPALSLSSKALAFLGPTLVHFVIGNFMEPLVFGSSMELHPVIVLMSLALWYALWGVPGAILAVPITAVVRIILGAVSHHQYAAIVIAILEGRVSTAMEGVDTALDVSGSGGLSGLLSGGGLTMGHGGVAGGFGNDGEVKGRGDVEDGGHSHSSVEGGEEGEPLGVGTGSQLRDPVKEGREGHVREAPVEAQLSVVRV